MSESLPPLPRDLDALLDAERGQREPPGVKDRVLRRLEAKLPLDSAPVAVPIRRHRARPQFWWWLTRAGVGGALTAAQLAAALGAGGVAVVGVSALIKHSIGVRKAREAASAHPRPAPPAGAVTPPAAGVPAVVPPPAPIPSAPPPVPPASAEPSRGGDVPGNVAVPETRRPPPARAPRPEATAPRPEHNSALAEDRVLLEEARVALLRGDTGSALEALTAHAQKFPNSPFAEEREALMVREAVRAGSYKEARAWYDRFRAHYPNSPMLPVLESSIRGLSHDEGN